MNTNFKRSIFWFALLLLCAVSFNLPAKENTSSAKTEKEMKPYQQKISQTKVSFEMVPIPGGQFLMGSPATEKNRNKDEGPQHKVKIAPFWMGKYEVTWDEYDIWMFDTDITRRNRLKAVKPTRQDNAADAVTRPSSPYLDFTLGYGHHSYPAICVTQLSAKMYCKWLSAKTGDFYRLPTEAEWEYACRAGTKTAYSFGNDAKKINDYTWHDDNSEFELHAVGLKKPNPWGLYDMHGNVAEWCLDKYDSDYYEKYSKTKTVKPVLNVPSLKQRFGRVVRGGAWTQKPEKLRSAARLKSIEKWNKDDPQIPMSVWFLATTDHIGFRIVRPLKVPSKADQEKLMLTPTVQEIKNIHPQRKRDARKNR